MIEAFSREFFLLENDTSSYIIKLEDHGFPSHIYFGGKLNNPKDSVPYLYTTALRELSEDGIILKDSDGSPLNTNFRFSEARKRKAALPSSLPTPAGNAESLEIIFEDEDSEIEISLVYNVYSNPDAITRRTVIKNNSYAHVSVERAPSAELGFVSDNVSLTSWKSDGRMSRRIIPEGTLSIGSRKLFASAESDPTFLAKTDEGFYALSLLYSGPHEIKSTVENKTTGISWGIHGESLSWRIGYEESFDTPEAILIYGESFEKASFRMRRFISFSVMRGLWNERMRPVMLFADTNEKSVAETDAEGIIVRNMFGGSLGEAVINSEDFPSGISSYSDAVHKKGLFFGLRFSPVALEARSPLFLKHPKFGEDGGIVPADITDDELRKHLTERIRSTVSRCSVDAIEWNIPINPVLPKGPLSHEFIISLYEMLSDISNQFPDLYIVISGGSLDPALLSYASSVFTGTSSPLYPRKAICRDSELFGVQAFENNEESELIRIHKEFREIAQFGRYFDDSDKTIATDGEGLKGLVLVKKEGLIKFNGINDRDLYEIISEEGSITVPGDILKNRGIVMKAGLYKLERDFK